MNFVDLLGAYPFIVGIMWDMLYGICLPDVLTFFVIMKCLSLPSVIFLTIKFILFYVNIANLALL